MNPFFRVALIRGRRGSLGLLCETSRVVVLPRLVLSSPFRTSLLLGTLGSYTLSPQLPLLRRFFILSRCHLPSGTSWVRAFIHVNEINRCSTVRYGEKLLIFSRFLSSLGITHVISEISHAGEKVNGERLALNEMASSTKGNLITRIARRSPSKLSSRNSFFDLSSSAMLHPVSTRPEGLSFSVARFRINWNSLEIESATFHNPADNVSILQILNLFYSQKYSSLHSFLAAQR